MLPSLLSRLLCLLAACLLLRLTSAFTKPLAPAAILRADCHPIARGPLRSHLFSGEPWQLTLPIADLDAETLDALGDIGELNDALDGVVDSAVNPTVGILTKLSASPLIVAVPILAGILVAFGFGYFVFSYGQGKDE